MYNIPTPSPYYYIYPQINDDSSDDSSSDDSSNDVLIMPGPVISPGSVAGYPPRIFRQADEISYFSGVPPSIMSHASYNSTNSIPSNAYYNNINQHRLAVQQLNHYVPYHGISHNVEVPHYDGTSETLGEWFRNAANSLMLAPYKDRRPISGSTFKTIQHNDIKTDYNTSLGVKPSSQYSQNSAHQRKSELTASPSSIFSSFDRRRLSGSSNHPSESSTGPSSTINTGSYSSFKRTYRSSNDLSTSYQDSSRYQGGSRDEWVEAISMKSSSAKDSSCSSSDAWIFARDYEYYTH